MITFISSAVSGGLSRTLTAPLDRVKVIMQASVEPRKMRGVFAEILHKGNYFALWKGNGTNVLKIIPETAIKFHTFEVQKKSLSESFESQIVINFVSGAIAGSFASFCIFPFEVVKTRLALADNKIYSGIFDCMRKIVKFEGTLSLYKGLAPSLLGILPYASTDLALFHMLKSHHHGYTNRNPRSYEILSFGAISGMVAQLVSYPLSLV